MSVPVPYTYEQWAALCSAVDNAGGALLPDPCEGQTVSFPKPGSDQSTLDRTCECGRESMFVIPYEPSDDPQATRRMRKRGAGFARVCGYCDYVGGWPKFDHVLEASA